MEIYYSGRLEYDGKNYNRSPRTISQSEYYTWLLRCGPFEFSPFDGSFSFSTRTITTPERTDRPYTQSRTGNAAESRLERRISRVDPFFFFHSFLVRRDLLNILWDENIIYLPSTVIFYLTISREIVFSYAQKERDRNPRETSLKTFSTFTSIAQRNILISNISRALNILEQDHVDT